jgi:GrpB-like predicted nucleotidyltransferase (UPF0157 family)
MSNRKVEVVPYDSRWPEEFQVESKQVKDALGENVAAIHHIGSTAIPGTYAKPIIDMLVEVKDLAIIDVQNNSMESLGYEAMGEFGIPDRRFFRKNNPAGVRTHHIHSFLLDSAQIQRHVAFRDYMIAYLEDSQAYGELKRRLAIEYPTNIDGYMDGKDEFIKEIDERAAKWYTSVTNTDMQ